MRFLSRAGSVRIGPLVILTMLFAGSCRRVTDQEPKEAKPTISTQPLDADQLAIYKAILSGWLNDGKLTLNLSFQTIPLSADDRDCAGKAAKFENIVNEVHRFREEDLPQIGGDLRLVDPEKQAREIRKNDPGKRIKEGSSIEDAVSNGFNHGLVTLSEIRFNLAHDQALVWFGFTCGGLCGNGGTVIMEKKEGAWQRKVSCSVWMSFLPRPREREELLESTRS